MVFASHWVTKQSKLMKLNFQLPNVSICTFTLQATPICNLNVALPDSITPEVAGDGDSQALASKYTFLREAGYGKFDTIHRADLRISDIGNLLGPDWVNLAHQLRIPDSDINIIKSEYPGMLTVTANFILFSK